MLNTFCKQKKKKTTIKMWNAYIDLQSLRTNNLTIFDFSVFLGFLSDPKYGYILRAFNAETIKVSWAQQERVFPVEKNLLKRNNISVKKTYKILILKQKQ